MPVPRKLVEPQDVTCRSAETGGEHPSAIELFTLFGEGDPHLIVGEHVFSDRGMIMTVRSIVAIQQFIIDSA